MTIIGAATGLIGSATAAHAAPRPAPERVTAADLVNSAIGRVWERRADCVPHRPAGAKTGATHDRPRPSTLDLIGALRRPMAAGDLDPDLSEDEYLISGETYVDFIRSATATDGTSFTIIVGRDAPLSGWVSASCRAAERAEVMRVLATRPMRERPAALRELAARLKDQADSPRGPLPSEDTLAMSVTHELGGGLVARSTGGGLPVARFRRRGFFDSAGHDGRSHLVGVVPDGVAAVTFAYPRKVTGLDGRPRTYAKSFVVTVRVVDNVLAVKVPRSGGDVYSGRMSWRDADGRVIRSMEQ